MGHLGDYARCNHEGRHRIKQQVDILHLIGKLLDGKGRDPISYARAKVTLPDPYADLAPNPWSVRAKVMPSPNPSTMQVEPWMVMSVFWMAIIKAPSTVGIEL